MEKMREERDADLGASGQGTGKMPLTRLSQTPAKTSIPLFLVVYSNSNLLELIAQTSSYSLVRFQSKEGTRVPERQPGRAEEKLRCVEM